MSEVVQKELPDGWERVPLKDAVHIILGQSPSSSTYNHEGKGLPFFQGKTEFGEIYPTVRKWCTEPKKIAEQEDVLVSVRAPVGPTNLAPYECAIGRGLAALRPLGGSDSKYFLYLIRRYQNNLAALGTGTTFEAISGDTLKNFLVPIAPPEQQKRIVAKIEELFSHIDAGIDALKKAKQLLKQYRQSVLKAAVTGELTKEWREANKGKLEPASQLLERILKERRQKWEEQQLEQFKAKGKMPKDEKWKEKYKEPLAYSSEGDLQELPESWVWASPEQIASTDKYALSIGPFGSNLKVSDYKEEGVPLVFVRNIRRHYYGEENSKYVTQKKAEELKAHSISGGDVLITKMGEPPGDASIYPNSSPDAVITADCIKWRFSRLLDCSDLYVHFINSPLIKDQVVKRTKGVAQKKISLGTFKSIAFPLPPLDEQTEILRQIEQKLTASDRLLKELAFQYIKAEKNKQSALASAFSGNLQ